MKMKIRRIALALTAVVMMAAAGMATVPAQAHGWAGQGWRHHASQQHYGWRAHAYARHRVPVIIRGFVDNG
jgi:hypothetical protein